MIADIRDYRAKGLSFKTAFLITSEMRRKELKLVKKVLTAVLVTLAAIYWLSDTANAMNTSAEARVSAELSRAVSEKEAMRAIVATCIGGNSSAGNLLKIGDEYFLCGLSPLGSFN